MGGTFPPPPIGDVSLDRASSVVAVTDESIYHACAKLARHKIGGIANRQVRPQRFRLRICSSHVGLQFLTIYRTSGLPVKTIGKNYLPVTLGKI